MRGAEEREEKREEEEEEEAVSTTESDTETEESSVEVKYAKKRPMGKVKKTAVTKSKRKKKAQK